MEIQEKLKDVYSEIDVIVFTESPDCIVAYSCYELTINDALRWRMR